MTNTRWGTLRVGRTFASETYSLSHQVNATTGEQSVSITGTETAPRLTEAQLIAIEEDFIAAKDQSLPVYFSSKTEHTGYYLVKDAGVVVTRYPEASQIVWNLSLQRIGTENAVDQESRVSPLVRTNNFALTGERWLAPSIGHYAFYTGSTSPSGTVSRTSSDGAITVYRGVPAGINPQWGCSPENYVLGRSRVLIGGVERSGVRFRIPPASNDWMMHNGLLSVEYNASATLRISTWDTGAWVPKDWNVSVGGGAITAWESMVVLRNDMEMTVLRFIDSRSPGRTIMDLTLRRGSRFVEVYVQTSSAATIDAHLVVNETTTNNDSTGYVVATSNDASGNKMVAGSARTFTGSTTGGVSLAATRTFGFFLGIVQDGSSAVSGDSAVNLRDQYIGAMAETVAAVRR